MVAAHVSRPKRLHAHLVDELGARIVRGDYPVGEPLPVEDALGQQFGVSRTVIREAVKVLAQKNLVSVRTRTGTRVCPPGQWNQLDPDILRWRFARGFDAKLLKDLVDLRRIIEPAAAELAALRATPGALARIRHAFAEMSDESAVDEHIAADLRFHLGILEAADNELLLGLRHGIEGALGVAIGFSTHTKEDGRSSLQLHGAVLQALERRDAPRARAAMEAVVQRWAADSLRIVDARSGTKASDLAPARAAPRKRRLA